MKRENTDRTAGRRGALETAQERLRREEAIKTGEQGPDEERRELSRTFELTFTNPIPIKIRRGGRM